MLSYFVRRLLQSLIVLFIVTVCAFGLMRLARGNPATLMLPDDASAEEIHQMEIKLGLDQPLHIQYWAYISGVLRGDLGSSLIYKLPVTELLGARLPNTGYLTLGTIIVGCLLAIPLGITAGANRGRFADLFCMFFALLGQSMSSMWLGVLLIFGFSVNLGWFPAMGTGGIQYMVLPVLTMAYPMAAGLTRVARSGMVDALSEDYITATYAKGTSTFLIYMKYALRNALIPVITMLGISMGHCLSGAVVTENIFGWAGIGSLLSSAVATRDYPVVQSLLLLSAFFFVAINFVVDIVNSLIDPRLSLN